MGRFNWVKLHSEVSSLKFLKSFDTKSVLSLEEIYINSFKCRKIPKHLCLINYF